MAGECILQLCDALLETHDLLPQPISLGRDRNNSFSHLRDVVLPAESFTALPLDGTVGAHPLSVVGPLARPTGSVLSHAHNFRTFVYATTHSHTCTSVRVHRDCPRRTSRISTRPRSETGSVASTNRTNLTPTLVGHRAAILRRRTLAGRSSIRAGTIGADVQYRWKIVNARALSDLGGAGRAQRR